MQATQIGHRDSLIADEMVQGLCKGKDRVGAFRKSGEDTKGLGIISHLTCAAFVAHLNHLQAIIKQQVSRGEKD